MNIPSELMYTKSHEWVEFSGDIVKIGLTDFAQNSLGDIVFINLPAVGDELVAGESFGDVESVKAVSDMISPVSCTVTRVNEELLDSPEKINEDPYDSWIVEAESVGAKEELLSAEEYEAHCAEEE